MLRKVLKGIAGLLLLLAVAGFLFVWQYLGVLPLEGKVDQLCDLVSNDVDFFLRFPGSRVLRTQVAGALAEEPGLEAIADLQDRLTRITEDVAREANPQVPLGLVQIDLENDLLGREMALAGIVRGDYASPRLDSFIALTRIAPHLRFVSALARDAVRERIPYWGERISVVKGTYFKVKLDEQQMKALAPVRSGRGRPEPDALWFGRIKDVLVLSDEPDWIEAAILGGTQTLPADVDFKREFMERSVRPDDVEIYLRPVLAQNLLIHNARPEYGGPLYGLSRFVPVPMVGDVTAQATPEERGIALAFSDSPMSEQGLAKLTKPYLVKIYEGQKADLRADLTEGGIGRFIPRRRVAAALLAHGNAETLAELLADSLSEADRQNLDEAARQGGGDRGRGYRSFEELLTELGKDLGDTHLLIVHRPSVFERVDFSTLEDRGDEWQPMAQVSFSLVSRLREAAVPEKVVEKFTQHLGYLGLGPAKDAQGNPVPALHQSGRFHVADPIVPDPEGYTLLHPAYTATAEGGKYFVFSSSVECMEAILAAASDPAARLLAEPAVAETAQRLPAEGTLALLVRGDGLHDVLADRVRIAGEAALYVSERAKEWRERFRREGTADENELDRKVAAEAERFRADEYPMFRERYLRALEPLSALDTAILGAALGVGPTRRVQGSGYLFLGRSWRSEGRSE